MADFQLAFEAIGTQWVIDIYQSPTFVSMPQLETEIMTLIESYDLLYSRFRQDSLVTKMSQEAGAFTLPTHGRDLLQAYRRLYDQTNGKFTPLIGQMLVEAGYDAEYSFQPQALSIVPSWDEVMMIVGNTVILKQPALLDFGAGGKGQLVDLISASLSEKGLNDFCVDGSGDVFQKSSSGQSLRVGLEHPEDPDQVIGVAEISNKSLCASAGNRRKWSGFHHIIDPQALKSADAILASWVVADSTLIADAVATALFLAPASQLLNACDFEYALLKNDYSLESSSHFPAEFFIQS